MDKKDFSLFETVPSDKKRDTLCMDELERALKNKSFVDFEPAELLNRGREDYEGTYNVVAFYKGSQVEIRISEEDFITENFESFKLPMKSYLLSHFGTHFPVVIKRYKKPYFYASRAKALLEYERYCFFEKKNPNRYVVGSRVGGRVVSVFDKFLIIEVGGIELKLKSEELSFSILPDLRRLYTTGMVLEVEITKLKLDYREERVRELAVSRKEVEKERIDKLLLRYYPGMNVIGEVTVNLKSGPIVFLDDGISVLARMGIDYARPQVGNRVLVEIIKVDLERRKLYGVLRSKSLLKNYDNL